MEQFNKSYWNERAGRVGHTGHSEPFYYCFDQQARLFAVQEVLKKLNVEKNNALDFGCGSGDFLRLLAPHFNNITGLDLSERVIEIAKQKNGSLNTQFVTSTQEIDPDKKFDLILTVTVLQALDRDELEHTLKTFVGLLNRGAKLIFLEFFPSVDYLLESGENRPGVEDWEKSLAENNFKIVERKNFYNPVIRPVKSWFVYRRHPFLLLLKPFKRFSFVQSVFTSVARRLIYRYKDVVLREESPLKLYVAEFRPHQTTAKKSGEQ